MNQLDKFFDFLGLDAPGEDSGEGGGLLALVDNLDILNQLIEPIHDPLSEIKTHFSITLLECLCEGLRVTVISRCFCWGFHSFNDVSHGFFSIILYKLGVKLFPEILPPFLQLVFLGSNTTEGEHGQLVEEEGFSPEFPLFVEHADFV